MKVYAYITQDDQVLVFRHADAPEAGIQVPGGIVHPGESLPGATVRETCEETGLVDQRIVAELGESWFDLADKGTPGEVHHRHIFRLRSPEPLPATWRHGERFASDGSPPILFEFFWLPIASAAGALIADMDALAHLLQVEK